MRKGISDNLSKDRQQSLIFYYKFILFATCHLQKHFYTPLDKLAEVNSTKKNSSWVEIIQYQYFYSVLILAEGWSKTSASRLSQLYPEGSPDIDLENLSKHFFYKNSISLF